MEQARFKLALDGKSRICISRDTEEAISTGAEGKENMTQIQAQVGRSKAREYPVNIIQNDFFLILSYKIMD